MCIADLVFALSLATRAWGSLVGQNMLRVDYGCYKKKYMYIYAALPHVTKQQRFPKTLVACSRALRLVEFANRIGDLRCVCCFVLRSKAPLEQARFERAPCHCPSMLLSQWERDGNAHVAIGSRRLTFEACYQKQFWEKCLACPLHSSVPLEELVWAH